MGSTLSRSQGRLTSEQAPAIYEVIIMSEIGLKDIIGLAMKGYKPADIKELLSIAETTQTVNDQGSEDNTEGIEDQAQSESSGVSSDVEDEKTPAEDQDTSKLKAEIISLQEKIKTLQSENIKKDIQGEVKTDQEKFEELVKNFY